MMCFVHFLRVDSQFQGPSVLFDLLPGRTKTMLGMMMNTPLLVSSILRHAANYHADREVVSQTVEGHIHRYTYADLSKRSQKLANALQKMGLQQGDRVGTLAWNGYRHFANRSGCRSRSCRATSGSAMRRRRRTFGSAPARRWAPATRSWPRSSAAASGRPPPRARGRPPRRHPLGGRHRGRPHRHRRVPRAR